MLFSLHFQSQLRRIRPELIASLENAIIRAAEVSGGKVRAEPRCIVASFEEPAIGFGLDMLLVLRTVQGAVERAFPELYGHTCVFGRDIAENSQPLLNRLSLSLEPEGPSEENPPWQNPQGSGIWCSQALWSILDPYAVFDASPFSGNYADYRQLRGIKPLARLSFDDDEPPLQKPRGEVRRLIPGEGRNALLVGMDFSGKRENLAEYTGLPPDFPPLVFRFGCGGTGLSCLSDALEGPIPALIPPEKREALDAMGAFLFKERLEDEFTPFAIKRAGQFVSLLLESYAGAAGNRGLAGTILVENIHLANPVAARVFVDSYAALSSGGAPRVLGTSREDPAEGEAGPSLDIWAALFPLVERFPPQPEPPENPCVPKDVAEIAYAVALFNRYFPESLTLQLFEEEGKNPAMIKMALGMLSSLGSAGMAADPQAGETALGDGKGPIQRMVRNRLLAWVKALKIRPGFKLLQALADLGEAGPEELVLEALQADLTNGTFGTLRQADRESRLELLAGPAHIPALRFMWRTTENLLWGDEAAIAAAFAEPWPPKGIDAGDEIPPYKTRILANITVHKLALHEASEASTLIREAMHLSQGPHGGSALALSYRLFSLANLVKGRISDAIDYSFFAVEQAENSENFGEAVLAAYYAGAIQFLFGNISRAERLLLKAEETALGIGLAPWADRARFFRGKLLFETGNYREAMTLFAELLRNPAGILSAEAEDTLEAWLYRSAVFLNDFHSAKPHRPNIDARYFEIEAAYLTGDYRRVVELADAFLSALPDRDYLFIEQPDWRSGFFQGELLFFSSKEFRAPLASAYRAMALCRLGKESHVEARNSIEEIVKDERFFEMDPNGAFYFFAYYRVLDETGATVVDMDTAVSMAYKRLQRRASRIDDVEVNRAFLTRHYWNGALSRAAREHKLI